MNHFFFVENEINPGTPSTVIDNVKNECILIFLFCLKSEIHNVTVRRVCRVEKIQLQPHQKTANSSLNTFKLIEKAATIDFPFTKYLSVLWNSD